MSEHTWVLENAAAYLAGGLDGPERERLERHVADCAACAQSVAEARTLDRKLDTLFADGRPGPTLEDAMIQRLQPAATRLGRRELTWAIKAVLVTAAAALLAVTGAGISSVLEDQGEQMDAEDGGFRVGVAAAGSTVLNGWDGESPKRSSSFSLEGLSEKDELKDADGLASEFRQEAERRFGKHMAVINDSRSMVEESRTGRGHTSVAGGIIGGRSPSKSKTVVETKSETSTPMAGPGGPIMGTPPAPPAHLGIAPGGTLSPNAPPTRKFDDDLDKKDVSEFDRRLGSEVGVPSGSPPAAPPAPGVVAAGGGRKPANAPPTSVPSEPGAAAKAPPEAVPPAGRKIIRSGEIDFEVDSFDDAVDIVGRLVAGTAGGFIATVNSDKLPNGKVRGSVVVRVPPDRLDALVTALRKEIGKAGELKGQRIGSQDITKQYTDLESRLKAGRTMEERLLRIIKDGKGEIKDLLLAEKELGVWRTRIEELEGELRYYANQVSLSTLTINLAEKEIRLAAAVRTTTREQMDVEVDDVLQALQDALAAVRAAKGRVTKSELKQKGERQFNAVLHFEVRPDPKVLPALHASLRQLGKLTRLEVDQVQHAEGGTKLPLDGKTEPGETQFFVSLYNLAAVSPQETVVVKVAAVDVPAAYAALRKAVAGTKEGHVLVAQLNEQDRQRVSGQLDFEVRRPEEEGKVLPALAAAGEVLSRNVSRQNDAANVSDRKVLYRVELTSAAAIDPRETTTLAAEVPDVETALSALTGQVKEAQGRVVQSQVGLERSGRVTGRAIYDVPLSEAGATVEKVKRLGVVRVHQMQRNPQAPEGKLALARIDVTLSNADVLVPRDEGLWAQLRHGVSVSLRGLSVSASWLVIGVLFVLPWVLLIMAAVWLARRLWPATRTVVMVETSTPPSAGGPV